MKKFNHTLIKQKMLYSAFSFFALMLCSTWVKAQNQTCSSGTSVMTGTVNATAGGLCAHSWTDANNFGDANLTTAAVYNNAIGIGCSADITLTSTTTYPAGTMVALVIENGGSTPFTDFIGTIAGNIKVELLNNGNVVQTIQGSGQLIDLTNLAIDGLGGIGGNTGAAGGISVAPFNAVKVTKSGTISGLTGMKFMGVAVQGGCFTIPNCSATQVTATSPSGFVANGTGNQTGNIVIPIQANTAGPVNISVSGGGFSTAQNPHSLNITTGQSSITIPVTFNGTGSAGSRTVTIKQTNLAGQDIPNNICEVEVQVNGKFEFNCQTSAVQITPSTFVNSTIAQAAEVIIPIKSVTAASTVSINLSNTNGLGNDFQATYSATLAPGQTQITIPTQSIPNFFDGTGNVGQRTLTFVSTDAGNTCTANVNVVNPLIVANENVSLNLGNQTFYEGNAKTDADPSQGVEITANAGKYNYYVEDCLNSNSTAGNATSSTTVLTSIAGLNPVTGQSYASNISTSVRGTVVMNRTTGAYTYTKASNVTETTARFCVRIKDLNGISPDKVVQYDLTNVGSGAALTAPTISSSPSPLVTGQAATLTANGCAGTVNWLNNGAPVGNGTTLNVASVPANASYTATCTVNNQTSTPSAPITSGAVAAAGDLAVAFTSNPGASFNTGNSKTFVLTVRNVGTTPSQATTLSLSSNISGFIVNGGGSQSIGVLQPQGQQTFSVTLTGNVKGASGSLNAIISGSADSNSTNNGASVGVFVAN